MPRVAGCDPGTSSLDIVILNDGLVTDQIRFPAADLSHDPTLPRRWLESLAPLDFIAGPSGYGLPLVHRSSITERDLELMALVRPDERGRSVGIGSFSRLLQDLLASDLPVWFLPGAIHLPTIPRYRKWNRIDLGTADKVAVVALALAQHPALSTFCLVEVGSAFTSCLVVTNGQIVDAAAGTAGPLGLQSSGAWDGEVAYWQSPLSKSQLFRGGAQDLPDGPQALGESLRKAVAGLKAVTPFENIILSGKALEQDQWCSTIEQSLGDIAETKMLLHLPGAWVKSAAQGAAIIADGLAGGQFQTLIDQLALKQATGTCLDYLLPNH